MNNLEFIQKVIDSCENMGHIMATRQWIWQLKIISETEQWEFHNILNLKRNELMNRIIGGFDIAQMLKEIENEI